MESGTMLERAVSLLDGYTVPTTNRRATREAVCLLLELADRQFPLLELLTIIGLADHLLIARVGLSITGDDHLMLPQGPVPAGLLAELYGACDGALWAGRVVVKDGDAFLVGSSASTWISRGYRTALDEAFDLVRGRSAYETLEVVCAACPTWWGSFGKVVPLAEAFVAGGANPGDAVEWVAEMRLYYRTDA